MTVLTEQLVKQLREEYSEMSARQRRGYFRRMAKKLGISDSTVAHAIRGRTWRSTDGPITPPDDDDPNYIYDDDKIFKFIVDHARRNRGVPPDTREIARALNIPSTSTVRRIVQRLIAAGRIEEDEGKARTIQVVGAEWTYNGE